MRKLLLSCAIAALGMSAVAATPRQQSGKLPEIKGNSMVTKKENVSGKIHNLRELKNSLAPNRIYKATRAEEMLNMQWSFCYDPWTAFTLESNDINQAMYVDPSESEMIIGTEVRSIQVANPTTYEYVNPVKTCKVWLTEDLDKDPFATGEGAMTEEGFEWSTIALDKPYVIEKDKPFYVGVSYTLPGDSEDEFGYITDYSYPEFDNTFLVYSAVEGLDRETGEFIYGKKTEWKNIGYMMGNACIRLDIYGNNLPTNEAEIIYSYAQPYVKPGGKVEVMVDVYNMAANVIKDVELTFQYEGEEVQTSKSLIYGYDENYNYIEVELPYRYAGLALAEFDAPKKEGNIAYEVKITKINGEANNCETSETGNVLCLESGYHKNVVVEEATGTWCGYCPAGWAGMEYIKEEFSEDGVIGIAMHEGDPMDVLDEGAYADLLDYIDGFPSCFYNRDLSYPDSPYPEYLEEVIPEQIEIPAIAKIEASLTSTNNANVLRLSTKSEFLFDGEEGDYEIGYTVVEDGLGPYKQNNYFSGDDDEKSYGFGSKSDPCYLKFNDVARNCSKPFGIEGSLPAIEKSKSYDFDCDVVLSGIKKSNNCRLVAMVINKITGMIENACEVKFPNYDFVGVKQIASEKAPSFVRVVKGGILIDGDSSKVNIYSTSGAKVAKANGFRVNLPAGIYIVTRGGESAKVIVK